jgi:hypothetical protein
MFVTAAALLAGCGKVPSGAATLKDLPGEYDVDAKVLRIRTSFECTLKITVWAPRKDAHFQIEHRVQAFETKWIGLPQTLHQSGNATAACREMPREERIQWAEGKLPTVWLMGDDSRLTPRRFTFYRSGAFVNEHLLQRWAPADPAALAQGRWKCPGTLAPAMETQLLALIGDTADGALMEALGWAAHTGSPQTSDGPKPANTTLAISPLKPDNIGGFMTVMTHGVPVDDTLRHLDVTRRVDRALRDDEQPLYLCTDLSRMLSRAKESFRPDQPGSSRSERRPERRAN